METLCSRRDGNDSVTGTPGNFTPEFPGSVTGTPGNFTSEFPEELASRRLWQIVAPVLLVVGFTGNALVLLVLKSMQFQRKATLFYFFVLAISDTVVLTVGLLHYWLMETFDINVRAMSDPSCKIFMFLIYFWMHMSSWTLVAVSVERFVIIKFPLHSSTLITARRARYSIAAIALTLLTADGYLLGTQHVRDNTCGSFPEDGFLYYFDEEIFVWIDFCLLSAIPATIMVICNISIVRELRRSVQRTNNMTRHQPRDSRVHISSLTRMLLAANIMFLLTTLPISVYFIVDTFLESAEEDPHLEAKMDLAEAVIYLFQYTNYTTNFYLYVARGKRFRQAFWAMIGRSHREPRFASSERGMSGRVYHVQANGHQSEHTYL